MDKVMVVGLGAVTSQGPDAGTFWEQVRDGHVAIRPVKHLDMTGIRTELGGEVEKVPIPAHDYGRPDGFADRAIEFALQAAEEAVASLGVDHHRVPATRWGLVLGTCNAGLLSAREWYVRRSAGHQADPGLLAQSTPQGIAEMLAGAFGLQGPVLSIDTACAAGANAIGVGADLIRSGRADAVLCGGVDALSDVVVAGFNALESLSPKPAAPYSKDRLGLSLGEGAGMLVLLRDRLVEELGVMAMAEIAGYGLSADAYDPTAPHPEGRGAARAVHAAMRAAGVVPADVDYVNSHGTGTAKNDPAETNATKVGLGLEDAYRVAVSSTKSMIGHLLGGAGAVEGLITVKAIDTQIAPPTANFTTADPECDLDYLPNAARPMTIDVAISNNFAFGGANASVVVRSPGDAGAPPPLPVDDVVVTGVGVMSPAGLSPEALRTAVVEGRTCWEEQDGRRIARVDFSAGDFLPPKERKRVDRLGQMSIITTRMALADAGLDIDDGNRERSGVILGTGTGPMESMAGFAIPVISEGPVAANPGVFPNTVYNAAAGQVAIKVGLLGPTSTVCTGHAAGLHALTYGFDLVRGDDADVIVALGADAITDLVADAYHDLGLIGPDGFALAEGAVALILERRHHAEGRGARILGQVLGHGAASDGRGIGRWDPDGDACERAVRAALDDAGLEPGDIATVMTAAAGLDRADSAEAAALDRVLGDGPSRREPLRGLGQPMGVGGLVGTVLALDGSEAGPTLITSHSMGGTYLAAVVA
ncbi:MAG TPA: beta-ketoacyl-[acyl-carrier-protein] synthase family protein [Euzebya sp.]|nr:beta-ketoacyl-[acyl-carrier-protein] synthase family protein [Euzebya sp.]